MDYTTLSNDEQDAIRVDEWDEDLQDDERDEPACTGFQIIIGTDEERVANQAIEALATRNDVFQRGQYLVHIVRDGKNNRGLNIPAGSPRIRRLPVPRLREMVSSSARWLEVGARGKPKAAHPPQWAVKAIAARGEWDNSIRPLEAVVECPTLLPDGTILQKPGYHRETSTIYAPNADYQAIPERPTKADAERAIDELLDVVCDFPFEEPTHRSAWLAALLTPFARRAIVLNSEPACVPMFLADANVRGSGKGKLFDAIGLITSGRIMPKMTQPAKEEEFAKKLFSIALAGTQTWLVDNIDRKLGSACLDMAITAMRIQDRLLGSNEAPILPFHTVMYGTGNNIVLGGDLPRRVLHMRLRSNHERPEERDDFKHKNLESHILANRQRLVVAALTVLWAYCAAGRPCQSLKAWGSFQEWSDLVRSAIVWAGQPDPAETRNSLPEVADTEGQFLKLLLDGWQQADPSRQGLTVGEALQSLNRDIGRSKVPSLHAAFEMLPPGKDSQLPSPNSVGMKLHHVRQRVVGGKFLERCAETKGGSAKWVVKEANA